MRHIRHDFAGHPAMIAHETQRLRIANKNVEPRVRGENASRPLSGAWVFEMDRLRQHKDAGIAVALDDTLPEYLKMRTDVANIAAAVKNEQTIAPRQQCIEIFDRRF